MQQSITTVKGESYLNPLFWVHGEDKAAIQKEIGQLQENGIQSFTVEPRPHPEYLKERWWQDLSVILEEAGKRKMGVWIFDDGDYPSGCAGGEIVRKNPQYRKKFIRKACIDALGPMEGSSFQIKGWLEPMEELIAVIAAKRVPETDFVDSDSLLVITEYMKDGILYWDLPEGNWRIFIIIKSYTCGEKHTQNHINPLEKEAVRAFIEYTYEPVYRHFKEEFGSTIKGFFTDEPRFGNYPSYHARLGTVDMPLPFSDSLFDTLQEAAGFDYMKYLPLLWQDGGEITAEVRYLYMNIVSRLFGECFTGQIGQWCSDRGVRLIGHVVEENGAHARLGFGAGHYYRSTAGLHNSGLDIVYNILPGYTSGTFNTPIFPVEVDFNHWGLAKMASSAAHIDPKKEGITMCEAFGAYGWQEGLKLMKWITDHLCVRGVNLIVPHAFTLREFPDMDCPPHFYAGGFNPQWKDFHIWSGYANRLCHLATGGLHKATAAVVYHAEAEWGGAYEPFEKTVKVLAKNQIDCDVIPIDCLLDESLTGISENELVVHKEYYKVLVVPYAQYLPPLFTKKLQQFLEKGLPVVFIKAYPERSYFEQDFKLQGADLCDYHNLASWFANRDFYDITLRETCEDLRFYHYSKAGKEIYFFVNESKFETVNTWVRFRETAYPVIYDPMGDKKYKPVLSKESIRICLEPYESVFVLFAEEPDKELKEKSLKADYSFEAGIPGSWKISVSTAKEYPVFKPIQETVLCNISKPELLPAFSGVIRYETSFDANECSGQPVFLDLGKAYETVNVWLNGRKIAACICPPYEFEIEAGLIQECSNQLVIEVTNTLAKQIDNMFDKYMPQEPSGLLGPVRLLWKKQEE